MKGETRTPLFLSRVNPNGRIPVLQIADRFIPESNAASYYVAEGSNLIPTDPFDHADMLRWMFWEQYNHEPNIATLRFWMRWVEPEFERSPATADAWQAKGGNAALKLMDDHLDGRDWFVGDQMSLADICLFAYTHVAGEADFEIKRYPNVVQWIERMKGQPRYMSMDA